MGVKINYMGWDKELFDDAEISRGIFSSEGITVFPKERVKSVWLKRMEKLADKTVETVETLEKTAQDISEGLENAADVIDKSFPAEEETEKEKKKKKKKRKYRPDDRPITEVDLGFDI